MVRFITRFIRDRSAATAIEYALIAGLMAVCLVTALGSVSSAFTAGMAAIGEALIN